MVLTHHQLPSDFELTDEDIARCQSDRADLSWIREVFQPWKAQQIAQGALRDDWKAAWWQRWEKSKPPREVEQPRPKPRLVVTKPRRAPETPLPDDWQPNANNAKAAAEEGYELNRIAEHFRNVCGAKGYVYVDHHKAFTNFIHNQKNFERGSQHARPKGSIVEAGKRAIANLDRQIREAEADEARERDGDQSVHGLPKN
jgi:hypothetical protein